LNGTVVELVAHSRRQVRVILLLMDKKAITVETYRRSAHSLAEKYDAIEPRVNDIEETLDMLNKEDPSVLEIGCGSGRDAAEILKRTKHYIGVDVSEELVVFAKRRNPNGIFVVADIENYSFSENLDAIIAFASLIHTPKSSFKKILADGLRALNSGGVFRISLKHGYAYTETTQEDQFGMHTFYFYSENDIKELAVGYKILKCELNQSQGGTWLEVLLQKSV